MNKKKAFENEFLGSLVEKYQISELSRKDPQRNALWQKITEEFNETTGNNLGILILILVLYHFMLSYNFWIK